MIKIITIVSLSFLLVTQGCSSQSTPEKEIFNEDFNWRITIPENFENVSAEDWKKVQNKGVEAIEDTYDESIDNQATTIFVFKSDQLNYFEANYQPYDEAIDGKYEETQKIVNDVLFETFTVQMP